MNRVELQRRIIKLLSWLRTEVEHNNSISFTDINKGAEDFYCGLLNIVYGYNLRNINIADPNAAAIDLGDHTKRIAIQVTSTSTLTKTTYTVDKFIEKGLHTQFDKLYILNIVKKSKHTAPTVGGDEYSLDTKTDIIDVGDLIKKINSNPDLQKLKAVVDFLEAELLPPTQKTLPNEVLTILGIIEYLSDGKHYEVGNGFLEEPIPEDKIFRRFADYADYLVDTYNDGYIEYGRVLEAVKNEADFGQVQMRRATNYLKRRSYVLLEECDGNPKQALNRLISDFDGLLGNNGYKFEAGAGEFFIVDQLMKCNVFPYKEVARA